MEKIGKAARAIGLHVNKTGEKFENIFNGTFKIPGAIPLSKEKQRLEDFQILKKIEKFNSLRTVVITKF